MADEIENIKTSPKSVAAWKRECEQLTARVRELEEENARLRFALADTEALELGTSEKLAASQLRETQLREALEFLSARIVTMDLGGVVERALALPRDTSALDAYIAEAMKCTHKQGI